MQELSALRDVISDDSKQSQVPAGTPEYGDVRQRLKDIR
jgi:hypothetical protein